MTTVNEIMSHNTVKVTLQDNIYEVAVLMKQHDTGFIPVVDTDGHTLLGVITDRDLVLRAMAEKHPGSTAVEHVMTTDVRIATPEMSVDEVAELMADEQIRRLPVTENKRLIGIVSIGDLAKRNIFADEAGAALNRISERIH